LFTWSKLHLDTAAVAVDNNADDGDNGGDDIQG